MVGACGAGVVFSAIVIVFEFPLAMITSACPSRLRSAAAIASGPAPPIPGFAG